MNQNLFVFFFLSNKRSLSLARSRFLPLEFSVGDLVEVNEDGDDEERIVGITVSSSGPLKQVELSVPCVGSLSRRWFGWSGFFLVQWRLLMRAEGRICFFMKRQVVLSFYKKFIDV